jgi:hypothetical protein
LSYFTVELGSKQKDSIKYVRITTAACQNMQKTIIAKTEKKTFNMSRLVRFFLYAEKWTFFYFNDPGAEERESSPGPGEEAKEGPDGHHQGILAESFFTLYFILSLFLFKITPLLETWLLLIFLRKVVKKEVFLIRDIL